MPPNQWTGFQESALRFSHLEQSMRSDKAAAANAYAEMGTIERKRCAEISTDVLASSSNNHTDSGCAPMFLTQNVVNVVRAGLGPPSQLNPGGVGVSGLNSITTGNPQMTPSQVQQQNPGFGKDMRTANIEDLASIVGYNATARLHSANYDNHPKTHFDFPKALEGYSEYNTYVMINLITSEQLWQLTDMAPWKIWMNEAVVMDAWIFDDHMAARYAYETPAKLVTSRKTSKIGGTVRWGIAQTAELTFHRTKMGQWHWHMQMIQMKNALLTSQLFAVDLEFLTCRRGMEDPKQKDHEAYTPVEFNQAVAEEIRLFDIMKSKFGPEALADYIKEVLEARRQPTTDVRLAITRNALQTIARDPSRWRFADTGIPNKNGPGDYNNIREVHGVRIYERKPLRVSSWDMSDLTQVPRTIGTFRQMYWRNVPNINDPAKYKTDDFTIMSYFPQTDRNEMTTLRDAFHNCGLYYTPPKDRRGTGNPQKLTEIGAATFWDYGPRENAYKMQQLTPQECTDLMAGRTVGGTGIRTVWSFLEHFCNPDQINMTFGCIKRLAKEVMQRGEMDLKEFAEGMKHSMATGGDAKIHAAVKAQGLSYISSSGGADGLMSDDKIKHMLQVISLKNSWWFEMCIRYNVPIWGNFRDCSPYETYTSGTGIAWIGGVANTLVSMPQYQFGMSAKTGMLTGQLFWNSRPFVHNPDGVVIIPDAFITGYLGGGDTEFFTYDERNRDQKDHSVRSNPNKSRFMIWMMPNEELNQQHFDLSGEYASFYRKNDDEKEHTSYHYLAAPHYVRYWGWKATPHVTHQKYEYRNAEHRKQNTMVFEDFCLYKNEQGEYVRYIDNKGHFKKFVYPGCLAARTGKGQYEEPVYLKAVQYRPVY